MGEAQPCPLPALRQRFLERLFEQRSELQRLAARDDAEEIIDIVHKIAGIAGSLGFPALSDRAKDAEEWIRNNARIESGDSPLSRLLSAIDNAISQAAHQP